MRNALSILLKFKKLFILDVIIALLFAVVYLIVPIATRFVTNEVIPNEDIDTLIKVGIFLLITIIVYACLLFAQTWLGHVYGSKIENYIRTSAFTKLQRLSFDYFDQNKVGQILSRVTTDANYISEMMHHLLEELISFTVVLIFGFYFMFQISVTLTLTFQILIILQIVVALLTSFKMSDAFVRLRQQNGELTSNAESGVSSIRLTRAFTNEKYENKNFKNTANWYYNAQVTAYKILGTVSSLNTFFLDFQTIAFIIVGGYLVIMNQITYGDWISFYIFYTVILTPIRRLLNLYESYMQGISAFKRYQEVIDEPETIVDSNNASNLNVPINGQISFNNVTFSYSDKTNVFANLALDLHAKKVTAIVGASGIGKSTLIHLIPRFYNLEEGYITIDDQDIAQIKLQNLRQNIGFVEQNVTIFNASIRDNILYGKLDASEEELNNAIKSAALEELIASLDNGVDTLVGEKGSFLSGGQKQRISLARIFIKNPSIIILDEATSALDTITENYVQEKIDELSKDRTVLIVAHRLSTIKNADEIIVLGDNKVLERGTHSELLKNNGHYRKLYNANTEGIIK